LSFFDAPALRPDPRLDTGPLSYRRTRRADSRRREVLRAVFRISRHTGRYGSGRRRVV